MQSFQRYKVCLFFILLNTQIVDTEYSQAICLPIFVNEESFLLFAHPSTFFN